MSMAPGSCCVTPTSTCALLAASDDRLAHLEDLQIAHQEGPCIDAFDTKQLVGVDNLEGDGRWPDFSAAAVRQHVRAVLASPLPYNQDAVGVVAVVSEDSHPWSPEGELALLAFTDLAALLIASMMLGEQRSELSVQLQGALDGRQVIEQAKGIMIGDAILYPRERPTSSCGRAHGPSAASWRPCARTSCRAPRGRFESCCSSSAEPSPRKSSLYSRSRMRHTGRCRYEAARNLRSSYVDACPRA